jgi:hypothetical protein
MRKIFLVVAMVFASASAQAAGSRSLTVGSADVPAALQATTTAAPQVAQVNEPTEAPKYVDRPPAVSTTPDATSTSSTSTTTQAPASTAKTTAKTTANADKPRRKPYWTAGRIIGELHRHGIYW